MEDIKEISSAEFYQSASQPSIGIKEEMELNPTPLCSGREPAESELEYIGLFIAISLNNEAAISILDAWSWLDRPSLGNFEPTFFADILDRAIRHLVARAPKDLARITREAEAEAALQTMGLNSTMMTLFGMDVLADHHDGWRGMGLLAWAIQTVTHLHDEYLGLIERRGSIVAGLGTRVVKDKETQQEGCVCGICLDVKVAGELVSVLECGHWFDEECITEWLMKNDDCPMCRREVMVDVDGEAQMEE